MPADIFEWVVVDEDEDLLDVGDAVVGSCNRRFDVPYQFAFRIEVVELRFLRGAHRPHQLDSDGSVLRDSVT